MSKTLLLSPEKTARQYTNMPRGILTIDGDTKSLNGKLRTYNLTMNLSETVVGVYFNANVYKTSLRPVEKGAYAFSLSGNYADLSDIYFAFICKNQVLLCGGTYGDCIANIKEQFFDENPDPDTTQTQPNDDYATIAEEDINDFFMQADTKRRLDDLENIHNDAQNVDTSQAYSQSMPYMDMPNLDNAFDATNIYPIQNENESMQAGKLVDGTPYEDANATPFENLNNTHEQNFDPAKMGESANESLAEAQTSNEKEFAGEFFANISEQLDELLTSYPLDDELNAIVPDAKFVKIADSETGESYVLGVISQDGSPRYLAYGIPSTYDSEPPDSMKGKCQWLPTDITDPLSDGYYIIYQDTQTGDLINIDIV